MSKGGAIRWTPEQLAQHEAKRNRPGEQRHDRQQNQALAPEKRPVEQLQQAGQATGKEKLQALGRLRDGTLNKTETAYAMHLTALMHAGKIQWFRFEGIKLRLADRTHLTVDFAVLAADGRLEMIDVKGARAIVQDDARVKLKCAAELYPFRFFMVYPKKARDGGGWEIEEI